MMIIVQQFAFAQESEFGVPLYRAWKESVGDHFYTTSLTEYTNAILQFGYEAEGIQAYVYDTQVPNSVPLYRAWNSGISDHFYTTDYWEHTRAVSEFGYVAETRTAFVYDTPTENSIPLYRSWNPVIGDHLYTTDLEEHQDFVSNRGYVEESIAGYVLEKKIEPVPLYRAWSQENGDHYYTTDLNEYGYFINKIGYAFQGIAAFVYEIQVPDSVPLYQSLNSEIGDHFYTISLSEHDNAVTNFGYRSAEDIAAYVFETQIPNTVPLYRSWNSEIGDHFYTTNHHEHTNFYNNFGYVDENIAAYVFNPLVLASTVWNFDTGATGFGSATGTAYVYQANPVDPLEKPIIIVDGIDFGDSRGNDEIFFMMNQQELATTLLNEGYDIIILNFHDGAGYVQLNALLLEDLIQKVNVEKVGDEPLVIIGPSMGGLVVRYALLDMEDKDMEHNTWLFISFDAPHQGANVPLGDQFFLKFFSSRSTAAQDAVNDLFSPAAKQLLVYHESNVAYGTSSNPDTGKPDFAFEALHREFSELGDYPSEEIRIVAVANGNGNGKWKFSAGSQLIDYDATTDIKIGPGQDTYRDADIDVKVYSLPDGSGYIFDGDIDPEWPFGGYGIERTAYVINALPYDGAPGSMKVPTVSYQIVSDAPDGSVSDDLLQDNETFIPTISALDIDTEDLGFDINGNSDIYDHTPFAHVLAPEENEHHMYISEDTKNFMLCEILSRHPETESYRDNCLPSLLVIPNWIRNNALWWHNDEISDSDFTSGIQFMITNGLIILPEDILRSSGEHSEVIPSWIKNTVGWWAKGQISDEEFVNALQFLIEKGIIRV